MPTDRTHISTPSKIPHLFAPVSLTKSTAQRQATACCRQETRLIARHTRLLPYSIRGEAVYLWPSAPLLRWGFVVCSQDSATYLFRRRLPCIVRARALQAPVQDLVTDRENSSGEFFQRHTHKGRGNASITRCLLVHDKRSSEVFVGLYWM